jgi:hypothetical protein
MAPAPMSMPEAWHGGEAVGAIVVGPPPAAAPRVADPARLLDVRGDSKGTNYFERRSIRRSHRPPFTTAPVADSQRSFDPLLFSTSARADSQRRWLHARPEISNAMDNLHDLVWAMFGVAVAAVMLVAGELYLVTRPDPP